MPPRSWRRSPLRRAARTLDPERNLDGPGHWMCREPRAARARRRPRVRRWRDHDHQDRGPDMNETIRDAREKVRARRREEDVDGLVVIDGDGRLIDDLSLMDLLDRRSRHRWRLPYRGTGSTAAQPRCRPMPDRTMGRLERSSCRGLDCGQEPSDHRSSFAIRDRDAKPEPWNPRGPPFVM